MPFSLPAFDNVSLQTCLATVFTRHDTSVVFQPECFFTVCIVTQEPGQCSGLNRVHSHL
jgi:hypothetical protein